MPKRTRTSDITTFSHMRQNLRTCLDDVKKSGRPLFVTTNGRAEAVILSAKSYDKLLRDPELAQSVASVSRGMKQIAEGRGLSVGEAFSEITRAGKLRRRKSA